MTARLALALTIVAAVGLGGCPDGNATIDAEVPLERCPLGDSNAPIELEIVHLDAARNVITTLPNMEVPLEVPPQGGWILLIGARATNLDSCQLTLTTSFRDLCNNDVIKLDRRPARLMPTGDGWGISTPATYGNLPVCPQVTSLRDLHDQPFVVTVGLEDIDGKTASKDITVVPVCPLGADRCTCECDHNYVLGGACPPVGPDPDPPC